MAAEERTNRNQVTEGSPFVLPTPVAAENVLAGVLAAEIHECQDQLQLWTLRLKELTRRQAIEK